MEIDRNISRNVEKGSLAARNGGATLQGPEAPPGSSVPSESVHSAGLEATTQGGVSFLKAVGGWPRAGTCVQTRLPTCQGASGTQVAPGSDAVLMTGLTVPECAGVCESDT